MAAMDRRGFIASLLALAAAAELAPASAGAAGAPQPFDRQWLRDLARRMASARYVEPTENLPRTIANLDHDAYQAIRFRPEKSLWADAGAFHAGPLLSSRSLLPRTGDAVRGGRRHGPRHPLRHHPVRLWQAVHGQHPRRPRLRRFPSAASCRQRAGLRGLPRRQLFPRRRRGSPVRPVGARAGHRHRPDDARGISALHRILAGTARG